MKARKAIANSGMAGRQTFEKAKPRLLSAALTFQQCADPELRLVASQSTVEWVD